MKTFTSHLVRAVSEFKLKPHTPSLFLFRFFGVLIMKLLVATVAVLTAISATNAGLVEKRQTSANDLAGGACKEIIFIFARGSTEPGNMVWRY
jgi:hypothetical protein